MKPTNKSNSWAAAIYARDSWTAPTWALTERKLIDTLNEAAVEYVRRYTREDGTIVWRDEWPGMDGSDDPYEAFMNLSLLYVLGGNEEILRLSRLMYDAITWQWTEYGQIHNEFDAYYDWMHHGEGSLYLYFLGLSDPHLLKNSQRAVKFAELYTGKNPEVPNYDAERKLMRSPITGSKGPRFQMTEEDWVTHRGVLDDYLAPFEDIPGVDFASGKCKWSDDAIYGEIITRMNERKAKGDVPLNLNTTGLITNAFMYTGDESYRQWVLDYLNAWEERTLRNGGLIPDNVGLNDIIGEYNDGKWWGGYYGYRWPHGFMSIIEPLTNAGMNAVLLSGDRSKLDLARSQLDRNWDLGKEINGKWHVPNKHFDAGWTDYRIQVPTYPIYLWTISMAEEDAARVDRIPYEDHFRLIDMPTISGRNPVTRKETKHYIANTVPWYLYMRGQFPDYPERILQQNLELIANQLEKLRSPKGDPTSWDWDHPYSIHEWQEYSPVYFEGLLQMMLGAPMHISHGGLQHARVRYFDADRKRCGLPEDIGALVEALGDEFVTLTLVNLSAFKERELIVQAGSFGEHQFTYMESFNQSGQKVGDGELDGKWLPVTLAPGAGIQLKLHMKRYVNQPTYETPWSAEVAGGTAKLIRGRNQV